MKLHDIAHSRAGDKGDTSNISVIARDARDFAHLARYVTVDSVRRHLNNPNIAEIHRYELSRLMALNFVLRGALYGGVTLSLALDAHGKCLSSVLLEMEIPERPLES